MVAKVAVLKNAGDQVTEPARIIAIIWSGSTSAGDTVVLEEIDGDPDGIWDGRAAGANTYIGISFPSRQPLVAAKGINVQSISSGLLRVYLEN